MSSLTPQQAHAYLERWRLVGEMEAAELRRTPMETKLRQLAALMQARRVFGVEPSREMETEAVRERWARIKRAIGV